MYEHHFCSFSIKGNIATQQISFENKAGKFILYLCGHVYMI